MDLPLLLKHHWLPILFLYGDHEVAEKPESIPDNTKAVFLEYTGNWTKALYIREKDKQYGALAKSFKGKRNSDLSF